MLIFRLDCRQQFDNDYIDAIINHNNENGKAIDEVWITTMYGYPSLEKCRENARNLLPVAEKFKKNGIRVSLQLANSIGHGASASNSDCSAASELEKMVGEDGTVAEVTFCWRGKNFKKYLFSEVYEYVSTLQPECLWIDDDFRPEHHNPVKFGCFCPDCMAEFNKRNNYSYTREQLLEEYLYGDKTVRRQFVSFIREGLSTLMRELTEVVKKACPNTAIGLQNCARGPYMGTGFGCLFDAMIDGGDKAPRYRAGGGFYHDHAPYEAVEKAHFCAFQNALLPDCVKCRAPEIENTPNVAFGKTPAGVSFESSIQYAMGATDMTFAMMIGNSEPFEWYGNMFKEFASNKQYWNRLGELSSRSNAAGLRYITPLHPEEKEVKRGTDLLAYNSVYNSKCASGILRQGLPIVFDRTEKAGILCGDEAKCFSPAEIDELLRHPLIADGEAIAELVRQGADIGVEVKPLTRAEEIRLCEKFTDHPINPKRRPTFAASYFMPGVISPYRIVKVPADCEILGEYHSVVLPPFEPSAEHPYGLSTVIITTKYGAKWAIFAYSLWRVEIGSELRNRLLNVADYITDNRIGAKILSAEQAVLCIREDKKEVGKTSAVSVTNVTIGVQRGLQVLIRNPLSEKFMVEGQYITPHELTAEKRGDGYVLTLPDIMPYSVVTIFCDK